MLSDLDFTQCFPPLGLVHTLEVRLLSSSEQLSIIDPLAMQSVFTVANTKLLHRCCQTFLFTAKVLPHNAQ